MKDVSGLVIIMCLVDNVVHMLIGLNPVYTFILDATICWLVAFICYMLCFPCTNRDKQLGVFVNVSFSRKLH